MPSSARGSVSAAPRTAARGCRLVPVARPSASNPRSHPVRGAKIFSRMRNESRLARMIQRLDTDDAFGDLGGVTLDVLHQLGLGIRWSGDQHGARFCDGIGDPPIKIVILGRAP